MAASGGRSWSPDSTPTHHYSQEQQHMDQWKSLVSLEQGGKNYNDDSNWVEELKGNDEKKQQFEKRGWGEGESDVKKINKKSTAEGKYDLAGKVYKKVWNEQHIRGGRKIRGEKYVRGNKRKGRARFGWKSLQENIKWATNPRGGGGEWGITA